MKKILLVVSFVFAVMAASSQLYVGGALGFALDGAPKDKDGNKWGTSSSIFGIVPEVGFGLSEKFDVGISIGFISAKETGWNNNEKTGSTVSSLFAASPYVRYSFVEFGKFSLLGKAAFNIGFGTEKDLDKDGKEIDGSKTGLTNIGVAITPVVLFDLSDRICLYTNLNFAGLEFNSTSYKVDGEKTGSQSEFGVGINTDNAFTTGAIQVGFVFKF